MAERACAAPFVEPTRWGTARTVVSPGWYADPLGRAELRWYNGAGWGEQVRSGAVAGLDPLDLDGTALQADPRWDNRPTGVGSPPPGSGLSVPPPAPRAGIGRGTKVALSLVLVAFVVLLGVGAVALVVIVRNAGALTTMQIELSVARSMTRDYGTPVTVDCRNAQYAGPVDRVEGVLYCVATTGPAGEAVEVEVRVQGTTVVSWQVVGPAGSAP